jgi:RHS repeat-associated protein
MILATIPFWGRVMVAINEVLLRECTGEECGGDNDICTDSRVHHRNAENRAPVTRNHRGAPNLGRWMEQDPAQYINGASTYQFVDSSPVGNVDAQGRTQGRPVVRKQQQDFPRLGA